jgi:ribokinase/sulfofructose kinase
MILVVGTACIDRFHLVPKIPGPGGYVDIEEEVVCAGGEALNTAVALNGWKAPVRLHVNGIGEGPVAKAARKVLGEAGLDLQGFAEGGPDTICDIYVTPDGEKTMFGVGFTGMAETLDLETIEWRPGEWFTTDPNAGDLARQAYARAHEAGMRCYLMDFVQPEESFQPGSYWQSSTDWIGLKGQLDAAESALRDFVSATGCFGVLTDGGNGFVAGSAERGVRHFPTYQVAEAVDSTGAGDIFRAGMLFGLSQGFEIEECLQLASAAAALNCRNVGGCSRVPTLEEVQQLIAAQPTVSQGYTF